MGTSSRLHWPGALHANEGTPHACAAGPSMVPVHAGTGASSPLRSPGALHDNGATPHADPGRRQERVAALLQAGPQLGLPQEVSHDAVQLLDRLGPDAASAPAALAAVLILASRQGQPSLSPPPLLAWQLLVPAQGVSYNAAQMLDCRGLGAGSAPAALAAALSYPGWLARSATAPPPGYLSYLLAWQLLGPFKESPALGCRYRTAWRWQFTCRPGCFPHPGQPARPAFHSLPPRLAAAQRAGGASRMPATKPLPGCGML